MKFLSEGVVDSLKDMVSLCRTATVALGIVVLFLYCVSEKIMPDGLSLGDVFNLVWIALGSAFFLVVGTLYGVVAALSLVQFLVRIANRLSPEKPVREVHPLIRGKSWVVISVIIIVTFLLFSAASLGKEKTYLQGMRIICFFLLFGYLLLCAFGVRYPGRKPLGIGGSALLIMVMFIACLVVVRPALLNFTMSFTGVRSEPGALIVVSSVDHERLDELAQQSGLTVDFCQLPRSSLWATLDARVVWHNVGTTSYISLLDRATGGEKSLLVPISHANLEVVRPEGVALTCKGALAYQQPS